YRCGNRESYTRIARCRFHDQPARPQLPRFLGCLDHRHTDTVLHRATGIEELGFGVHGRANPARDLVESDQRRPADRLEDVVVRLSVLWHSYPCAPLSYPVAAAAAAVSSRSASYLERLAGAVWAAPVWQAVDSAAVRAAVPLPAVAALPSQSASSRPDETPPAGERRWRRQLRAAWRARTAVRQHQPPRRNRAPRSHWVPPLGSIQE